MVKKMELLSKALEKKSDRSVGMREHMKEGWGVCPSCKVKYYATEVSFPVKDVAHDIGCPNCGHTIGWVSKGTDDIHVMTEADVLRQQQEEAKKPNCPKCGRKMTKKKGYSEFWGCSAFPKCDGTRQINDDNGGYYNG